VTKQSLLSRGWI